MKPAGPSRGVVEAALLAVALAAIPLGMIAANHGMHGDFFATLPGPYVETLNPALWNSDDLRTAWGFHRDFYHYGPTQYLTIYPIVWLKSYKQIAILLSCVYAIVLSGAIYLLSRLVRPSGSGLVPGIVVLSLLFAPLLQAYVHLEFEVVVFFAIVTATSLLVMRRDGWAGALFGYVTWFKIWPVIFLGYFLAKRQFRAVAGFVLASILTLGIAQLAFGLDRFMLLSPSLARSIPGRKEFFLSTLITPLQVSFDSRWGPENATGQGFCKGWVRSNETYVSARWGMCGLIFSHRWPSGVVVFYGTGLMLAALFAAGFLGAERRGELDQRDRTCRIVCEISLIIIGSALTLIAHYYYFIFLTLPICVLAHRYAGERAWGKFGWLASAYAVLGGLVGPFWLWSRLAGKNFWGFYAGHSVYLYGLVTLTALIMWEYLSLGVARQKR
jgi:glycosyl transferase family 87